MCLIVGNTFMGVRSNLDLLQVILPAFPFKICQESLYPALPCLQQKNIFNFWKRFICRKRWNVKSGKTAAFLKSLILLIFYNMNWQQKYTETDSLYLKGWRSVGIVQIFINFDPWLYRQSSTNYWSLIKLKNKVFLHLLN